MFVVKSAGSSFTGFVPCGRLDELDDDPPPPQAARARTAIATAIDRIMRRSVGLPREIPMRALVLARDPAEVAQREQRSGDAPDEDHGHVLRLAPERRA